MTHLDFTNTKIDQLITHHVGNKSRDEKVMISQSCSEVDDDTMAHLLNYFTNAFKPVDFYTFTHAVNIELNEVLSSVKKIFYDENFIEESQNLARLLYEYSTHPKIKSGEFNVVLFRDVIFDDNQVLAIGLYKSENQVPFIQMDGKNTNYTIKHDYGFELQGIDKACIIFNSDVENDHQALVVDNLSGDAQYWLEDFLHLKPASDDYNNTKNCLSLTKEFVTKKLPDEVAVSNTDKIDMLNKTMEYFKDNETFDQKDFEEKVFEDETIIKAFREFDDNYRQENELTTNENFDISSQAVKKQARQFKSVLKLDKNFHIYIHGAKDMIERGVDENGRKFYKIYYDKES